MTTEADFAKAVQNPVQQMHAGAGNGSQRPEGDFAESEALQAVANVCEIVDYPSTEVLTFRSVASLLPHRVVLSN